MIAMQYSFTLPADYDMGIIRDRIAAKGHMLDAFPDLIFKAYLHASKNAQPTNSAENLYAPFYLWENTTGMNNFLCGPGFAGLAQAFGRPLVKVWSVLHRELTADAGNANFATRTVSTISAQADLIALREAEVLAAQQTSRHKGCLAAVSAFDPHDWTLVRMQLWHDASAAHDAGLLTDAQAYEVGHMSVPTRLSSEK